MNRLGALLALALALPAAAEPLRIGAVPTTGSGPLCIAHARGLFAAEGFDAKILYFEAAQAVAVAAVAGDVDIGVTGLTAGFYNLAGQGVLRIVGAQGREAPGFHNLAFLASNRAEGEGLKDIGDLGGRRIAVTQPGTPGHYALGLAADKYGFDLATVRLSLLQSIPNVFSALTGGQIDAGVTVVTVPMMPAIDRGDLRLLAWAGDLFPIQDRAIFVATRMADGERPRIERFFRAFRKGLAAYHDAFIGPDERPAAGPGAEQAIAEIAQCIGQPAAAIKLGLAYVDPSLRVNVGDIRRQIAWYKSHGMLKPDIDGDTILDRRYVVPLPGG